MFLYLVEIILMNKKKVLHVITGLHTGGAERSLYNILVGGLAKEGNMAVLSLQDEGYYADKIRSLGVPVYSLNMKRGLPTLSVIFQLRQLVQEYHPDIIQGWMYHGNLAASLASRLTSGNPPAVFWNVRQCLYSLKAEKFLTRQVIRVNRWLSNGVSKIIYNSQLSRIQHEAFGFAENHGQVIPNGFDTEVLQPDFLQGKAVRELLAIPSEALVIGHVARFHPMKDHVSFLRAAVDVMRQRPGIFCLLIGRDVSLNNPALTGIVPAEFVDRFHFFGERDDVPDLMQAMDIFCQSSWSEAFPNVLGEAMSLGIPCVATEVGDSSDVVADTGTMAPPSDSQALTNSLLAMVDRSSEERAILGRAARLRVQEHYSLSKVVGKYSDLYAMF